MTSLLDRFSKSLDQLLTDVPDAPILLAVSGGADSMVMLDLFSRCRRNITVAHFDHHIREKSAADALRVAQRCAELGIPFTPGEADVPAYARQQQKTLEDAARILRYEFLTKAAERLGATVIATAHTADDQAETVLMHLLRGSGVQGIAGMPASARLEGYAGVALVLIRPMLSFWRAEIEQYLAENNLTHCEDETNLLTEHFRNRIRLELIPELETYNPQVKTALVQLASIAQAERQYISRQSDIAAARIDLKEEGDIPIFDRVQFIAQDGFLQSELLLMMLRALPGQVDYDRHLLDNITHLLTRPAKPGQQTWILQKDLWLQVDGKIARLSTSRPAIDRSDYPVWKQADVQPLLEGLPLFLTNGFQLKIEPAETMEDVLFTNPDQAWLDMEQFRAQLLVRTPDPGDRFQPLGMTEGSQKLSDFFTNRKVPAHYRATYPLVVDGDQIVWVPGLQIAERYKIKTTTTKAVVVTLIRPET